ncbi:MAG: ABC transporter ATP-binding protein [Pseudomonadota bacterium]
MNKPLLDTNPGAEAHDAVAALELAEIERTYNRGRANALPVLRGANLQVWPGEVVALVGPSGSGKSTLLHLAGLLEKPEKGEVLIAGRPASGLKDKERTLIRRAQIGFVYQFHHLLPEFSAIDNVVIPQMIAGRSKPEARTYGQGLLEGLGLKDRLKHQPGQLSGGEQQRVAIARALANRPRLLLADEPTGNLDPRTAISVFESLLTLARQEGVAALIATHNLDLAEQMDRIVLLQEGELYEVEYSDDDGGLYAPAT